MYHFASYERICEARGEIVLKFCRTFAGAVAVLLLVSAGNGTAIADPISLEDVDRSMDTDDGYHFTASLNRISVNSVPNMAATAFTREAFVSASAKATIAGPDIPVRGSLELAVQLGCQIDLKDGMSISVGPDAVADFDTVFNPQNVSPSFSGLIPSMTVNLKPGTITQQSLGIKDIKGSGDISNQVSVYDAHLSVDGCGGPVSVRLIAAAEIMSGKSDDKVTAYGSVVSI